MPQALKSDLLAVVRSLWRSPAATAMMVVTLALGLGANLTLFSYVSVLAWDQVEVPRASEVFHLRCGDAEERATPPTLADWRSFASADAPFTERAAGRIFSTAASSGERTWFEWGWMVSGDYFALLGQRPQLGRWLQPSDDQPGAPPVVVISDRFWARHFERSPEVLGKQLVLDARTSFTVVGVASKGFQAFGLPFAIYVPFEHGLPLLHVDPAAAPLSLAVVRLAPGARAEEAEARLAALGAGLDAERPRTRPRVVSLRPVGSYAPDAELAPRALLLWGVVVLFLLLAAANAANLLLARTLGRRQEWAVLLALGASPGRLVGRLGLEVLMLVALAGTLGWALGWLGVKNLESLLRVVPPGFGHWAEEATFDFSSFGMLGFGLGASLLSALIFGLAPLLAAASSSPALALRESSGGLGGRGRLRNLLVALQVGIGVVLFSGAMLLAGSLNALRKVNPGFPVEGLWIASIYQADPVGVEAARVRPQRAERLEELAERLRGLPEVAAVGTVARAPLFGGSFAEQILLPGAAEPVTLAANVTGVGYFETLGVPLLAGRGLDSRDRLGATPVVLVNRSLADLHFPAGALGQMLTVAGGLRPEERGAYQVVGVVADARFQDLRTPPGPQLYFAAAQRPWNRFSLAIRLVPGVASPGSSLFELLTRQGPDLALADLVPLAANLENALFEEQLSARVLYTVAALGLLLAVAGTYSVTRHSVGRRGRELALRMALGARRGDNEGLVVREAARWVGLGLAMGLAGALGVGQLLRSLLFGVSSFNPWALALAATALGAAGLLAAWLPARQAARLDPSVMLRRE